MPFGFHGLDLVVILVIALLIFGPKKLPEMGEAIGKSIKQFKKGVNEITAPEEEKRNQDAANLEAIDREIASRRAAEAERQQATTEAERKQASTEAERSRAE